jgi:prepilin-type N-terminal cleavage/methylation domain-containing protein
MSRRIRQLADDAGFTIIEMIVATALAGLVLAAVGGVYISTIQTQRVVSTDTAAANNAQLAARGIDHAMRNGSSFYLASGSDGGQMLVVRTAGSGSAISWSCAIWYYSPLDGGQIRSHVEADGSSIGLPGTDELAGWTLLTSGVSVTGTAPFTVDPSNDNVLFVDFTTIADDGDATTTISFSAALSPVEAEESDTCS